MNTKHTLAALMGCALIVAGIVFIYAGEVQAPTQETSDASQATSVTLTVEGLYAQKTVADSAGKSVLELLQSLHTEDPQLALTTKEYSGLGVLIESMHGLKNGTGQKYWQFKVNGVMPQIGADKLILKGGDTVEWYFGTSQD